MRSQDAVTLMYMKLRIVLSTLVFTTLLLLLPACSQNAAFDDSPSDDVGSADGIGTSPSDPSDPEGLALLVYSPGNPVAPCGVWLASTSAEADEEALGCAPPDAAFFVAGQLTCIDAIHLADAHPGKAVVRQLDYQLRALQAGCY